jgi:hypothetical protein
MSKAIHGAERRRLDRFIEALSTFSPAATCLGRDSCIGARATFDNQLMRHHEGEHALARRAARPPTLR